MTEWELFESKCTRYLQRNFMRGNIEFSHSGRSNSTLSDIKVIIDNDLKYFIEVKMPQSQSGQFVLLDNGHGFNYSDLNRGKIDEYSRFIMEFINQNYVEFKSVSTRSIPINIDESVFSKWIISHYKSKNVRFIITEESPGNFVILPIGKFSKYFNVHAVFRIKASGSRELSQIRESEFKKTFKANFGDCILVWRGEVAYVKTKVDIPDKMKIDGIDYRFQLNRIASGTYQVKMLSNTRNANVIFQISLKCVQDRSDLNEFVTSLQ